MRMHRWFVLGAVLAMLVAMPAVAGERGQRGAQAAKDSPQAECELMIKECKLTEQQQTDLKAKVKAKEEALAAWNTANAEKLKAADDAAKAARAGTDADAKRKASENLKALHADREQATAKIDADILAILTPEQKAAWEAFKLYQTEAARYKKANLTEEQLAKIKAACAAASKQLSASDPGDERAAKRAKTDIAGKLRWAIDEVILTAAPREAMPKKPAAKQK